MPHRTPTGELGRKIGSEFWYAAVVIIIRTTAPSGRMGYATMKHFTYVGWQQEQSTPLIRLKVWPRVLSCFNGFKYPCHRLERWHELYFQRNLLTREIPVQTIFLSIVFHISCTSRRCCVADKLRLPRVFIVYCIHRNCVCCELCAKKIQLFQ